MLNALDTALLRRIHARRHPPAVQRAVATFSRLGEHGGVWLGLSAAGALVDRERREEWLRAGGVVLGSYVVNQAIKFTVRRRRPQLPDLPPLVKTPSNRSYPSAHATTSFAAARSMSDLLPPAALYAVAVPLAASRPYLGVHYPSDTVAGAVLGHAVAELAR